MRLGIIGYGNMAGAILDGVLRKELFSPEQISVFDPGEARRALARKKGVTLAEDNRALCRRSDLILLSVKPQVIASVLDEIAPEADGKCFASIAAGISTDFLRSRLGAGALCVRIMPNTPMMLGCGAVAVARAPQVPDALFQTVCGLFSAAGTVSLIDEKKMDEITGVNGSSPAYFFRMAAAMEEAAVEQGIDRETARVLIAKTMEGSAKMLQDSGKTAGELTAQVTSPGGTTLAALTAFDEGGFDALIREAMLRCTKRSRELGR